ncbi:helix-turn-helix domain-containing protein [Parasphingorhabdus flavimaris]|uniref:helix-turn-helix domain-containing protein n=1 Tax=Parasphingorhabdus flavimaris TaxID=266812 RepID=UPI0030030AF0
MEIDLISGALEAAAYTGLSRRQIYRLAEEGHIPIIRKGRRMYFRRSELDRAFSTLETAT